MYRSGLPALLLAAVAQAISIHHASSGSHVAGARKSSQVEERQSAPLVNLRAHRGKHSAHWNRRIPDSLDELENEVEEVQEEIPEEPVGPSAHDAQGEEEDVLEEQLDSGHADRHIPMPVYALALGILSGVSMPIGALLGIKLSPVRDDICAAMMAFGAGALLFAVTVELYGHALHEVRRGRMGMMEMNCTMTCAVGGAIFYLYTNRWLEEKLGGHEEHPPSEPAKTKALAEDSDESDAPIRRQSSCTSNSHFAPIREVSNEAGGRGAITQLQIAKKLEEEHRSLMARQRWKKIRDAVRQVSVVAMMQTSSLGSGPSSKRLQNEAFAKAFKESFGQAQTPKGEEVLMLEQQRKAAAEKAERVALGLFLGLLIDGIPEGILMGFLAAEGHLTPVFIVSLFVANFPEAFCSASLLKQAQMSTLNVVSMWLGLCILVGCLCGASCWLIFFSFPNFSEHHDGLPFHWRLLIAGVEGMTGGAMIACISSVMLPEAFERAGKGGHILMSSGFFCVLGFLLSVFLKASGG